MNSARIAQAASSVIQKQASVSVKPASCLNRSVRANNRPAPWLQSTTVSVANGIKPRITPPSIASKESFHRPTESQRACMNALVGLRPAVIPLLPPPTAPPRQRPSSTVAAAALRAEITPPSPRATTKFGQRRHSVDGWRIQDLGIAGGARGGHSKARSPAKPARPVHDPAQRAAQQFRRAAAVRAAAGLAAAAAAGADCGCRPRVRRPYLLDAAASTAVAAAAAVAAPAPAPALAATTRRPLGGGCCSGRCGGGGGGGGAGKYQQRKQRPNGSAAESAAEEVLAALSALAAAAAAAAGARAKPRPDSESESAGPRVPTVRVGPARRAVPAARAFPSHGCRPAWEPHRPPASFRVRPVSVAL